MAFTVWRDERGANLVEMAMVSLLLLILLAGATDVGRALNSFIVITNAAREGARYGSLYPHLESGIQQAAVLEAAGSGVALSAADVTVSPSPSGRGGTAQPGTPVRVTVQTQVDTILAAILGMDSITMHSSTEMIVFGQDL
jgi:Flp pilus assembly protein TadG